LIHLSVSEKHSSLFFPTSSEEEKEVDNVIVSIFVSCKKASCSVSSFFIIISDFCLEEGDKINIDLLYAYWHKAQLYCQSFVGSRLMQWQVLHLLCLSWGCSCLCSGCPRSLGKYSHSHNSCQSENNVLPIKYICPYINLMPFYGTLFGIRNIYVGKALLFKTVSTLKRATLALAS
jgi:hypothetical protein